MIAELVKQALAAHPGIELTLLFGSQANGTARIDSDVDIAVLSSRPLDAAGKTAIVADIGAATGRAIDLVDIRTAGESLLGQILTHGVRLHGSATTQAGWLYRHLVDSADFMPYVQRLLTERRRAWIGS